MKMWFEVKLYSVNIELQKKKGMKIGYIYMEINQKV
jgi:hypothetical protein